jgi:hypothetical protein
MEEKLGNWYQDSLHGIKILIWPLMLSKTIGKIFISLLHTNCLHDSSRHTLDGSRKAYDTLANTHRWRCAGRYSNEMNELRKAEIDPRNLSTYINPGYRYCSACTCMFCPGYLLIVHVIGISLVLRMTDISGRKLHSCPDSSESAGGLEVDGDSHSQRGSYPVGTN